MHQEHNIHIPVLLDAVLQSLSPKEGHSYLDLTAGYGGHARAVLALTKAPQRATLVDRDEHAIASLVDVTSAGAQTINADFLTASTTLVETGQRFDMILADLGLSSPHIDNASRGFAFATDGPLDMRMDQRQTLTADIVVNTYAVDDLIRIIKQYGEEPRARTVAQAIVKARPIVTTTQLADVIRSVIPYGKSKTNPATKTFQALRIAVNDELEQLRASLPLWFNLLQPGGRIAVISFHSLEDRIVKHALQEVSGDRFDADLRLINKRPITADESELVFNPRARSAKLRAAVKK